jgi:hypothetical protein
VFAQIYGDNSRAWQVQRKLGRLHRATTGDQYVEPGILLPEWPVEVEKSRRTTRLECAVLNETGKVVFSGRIREFLILILDQAMDFPGIVVLAAHNFRSRMVCSVAVFFITGAR